MHRNKNTHSIIISSAHFFLGLFIFAAALPVFAQQVSIWNKAVTPSIIAEADDNAVEVGVQLRSTESGVITSILFYRGPGNGGTHVGNIWADDGTLLATVEFTNETVEDGWQQADFNPPVPITAGQIYTASYHAPLGNYAVDSFFFDGTGVSNGPLQFLQDGVNGGNGVYNYTPTSDFPDLSYNASNYWVDVIFTKDGPITDSDILRDLDCDFGQGIVYNGTAWQCITPTVVSCPPGQFITGISSGIASCATPVLQPALN